MNKDKKEEIWLTDNIQIVKEEDASFSVNLRKSGITVQIATFYNSFALVLFLEKFMKYIYIEEEYK